VKVFSSQQSVQLQLTFSSLLFFVHFLHLITSGVFFLIEKVYFFQKYYCKRVCFANIMKKEQDFSTMFTANRE